MTTELFHPILELVSRHKSGDLKGIYSICSANEYVLKAAILQALSDDSDLLIEATCNQVNQFGGYTGQTPAEFVQKLLTLVEEQGFPRERLILGGDHLGPSVWTNERSDEALSKSKELVRDYVLAGFTKIHLDASMSCVDDPDPLPDELVAARAAELCEVAEAARQEANLSEALVYVVGTEVPVPGGATEELDQLIVTPPFEVRQTISNVQKAFMNRDLEDAWSRVVAVVVQPGVEFSSDMVVDYDRDEAAKLSKAIEEEAGLVYEAHSTDYQKPRALRQLVEDHFALLKVGPWLTFAFREAVLSLCLIEEELQKCRNSRNPSRLRGVLEEEMLSNPMYWEKHYEGSEDELAFLRWFSLSDRIRYYWQRPRVQEALSRLWANLAVEQIPFSLLSQYLPEQFVRVREGLVPPTPVDLAIDRVREVLRVYSEACGMTAGSVTRPI